VVLARAGDRDIVLVADADDQAVIAVDAHRGLELSRVALDGAVGQVLVAPDGRIVASVADRDRVAVVAWEAEGDGGKLVSRCSRSVRGEPTGMAMRGDRLLVASRWSAELAELDAETLDLRRTIPLDRDPYAVAFIGPDDALVTHVVGGRLSRVGLDEGRVDALDASRVDHKGGGGMPSRVQFKSWGKRVKPTPIQVGPVIRAERAATHAYAIAVAEDGRAFVPASLADGSASPRRTGYGGGGSGIRTHSGVNLVITDEGVDVPRGDDRFLSTDCQLPRGVAWAERDDLLFVACRGTDAVHVYDRRTEHRRERLVARIDVPAGPTGLALDTDQRRLFVWSQFSGSLSVVELPSREGLVPSGNAMVPAAKLAAEIADLERRRPLSPVVRRGRELFHEAGIARRIAADGRACASCHPDGRDDALSWATVEGPRQTPILMARLEGTAPFGWNGRKADVQEHLERTLARLSGTGLSREEREAIVAYIGTMKPPPSAITEDRALVARGAALYTDEAVGCAGCHPTSAETNDGLTHALGPLDPSDRLGEFDTPSLRFVARSAPYFHDGRYPTLDALLADPDSRMGHSASLPAEDRRALKAYLQTL